MAQPFFHDELEIKQHLINLAREFQAGIADGESIEKELAAALIYMNLADYLAEYLVVGLNELAKEAMGKYYLGVLSVLPVKRQKLNIGESIHQLQHYEFPQKPAVIAELTAINGARQKIAHQMFKTKGDQLTVIDEAERDLVAHTESLILLVDEISAGLPPRNLLEKMLVDPSAVQDDAIKEAGVDEEEPKGSSGSQSKKAPKK